MKNKKYKNKFHSTILHLYDDEYIERKAEGYLKLKIFPHIEYLPFSFEEFLWKEDILDKCNYYKRCSDYRVKKCSIWEIKSIFINEAV